jgi:hypothetical protein
VLSGTGGHYFALVKEERSCAASMAPIGPDRELKPLRTDIPQMQSACRFVPTRGHRRLYQITSPTWARIVGGACLLARKCTPRWPRLARFAPDEASLRRENHEVTIGPSSPRRDASLMRCSSVRV